MSTLTLRRKERERRYARRAHRWAVALLAFATTVTLALVGGAITLFVFSALTPNDDVDTGEALAVGGSVATVLSLFGIGAIFIATEAVLLRRARLDCADDSYEDELDRHQQQILKEAGLT